MTGTNPSGSSKRAQTPLSAHELLGIMAARVALTPRSTVDIVDLCQAAYPHYRNISTPTVRHLLEELQRQHQVELLHGNTDVDRLEQLGISAPHPRWLYWILSSPSRSQEERQ